MNGGVHVCMSFLVSVSSASHCLRGGEVREAHSAFDFPHHPHPVSLPFVILQDDVGLKRFRSCSPRACLCPTWRRPRLPSLGTNV